MLFAATLSDGALLFQAQFRERVSHLPRPRRRQFAPFLGKVLPFWVDGFNQSNFSFSGPALNLLLAAYGRQHVTELLVINQTRNVITSGKTGCFFRTMLRHASADAVGHSNVKRAGFAYQDVGV